MNPTRCVICNRPKATTEDFPLPIGPFDKLPKLVVCFRGTQRLRDIYHQLRNGPGDPDDNDWNSKALLEQADEDCTANEVNWRERCLQAEAQLADQAAIEARYYQALDDLKDRAKWREQCGELRKQLKALKEMQGASAKEP